MIYKIQRLFEKFTSTSSGKIISLEELNNFLLILKRRKIIIEHDIDIIKKFIIDFPITFENLCSYICQIYQLEIEKNISNQLNNNMTSMSNLFSFLTKIGGVEVLNNQETSKLLSDLNYVKSTYIKAKKNFKNVKFDILNLREEIYRIVWEPIKHQFELVNKKYCSDDKKNLSSETIDLVEENMISNALEYQVRNKSKIENEYDIIKTKKVYFDNINHVYKPRMYYKIAIEKTFCADRGIPIETWRIPFNYFDSKILSRFYYKCEAQRELLLSKHFQKFTGYDDFSSDDNHVYYFESIEGVNVKDLIIHQELELSETSMLFVYLSKEILTALRDLLYKCTYSFDLPITIENVYYEVNQRRLYLNNIKFDRQRSSIAESHEIIEAKLLYQYAIILIELLSITIPEMKILLEKINFYSQGENENTKMKIVYERLDEIEDFLSLYLESDIIIGILIECLATPFKSTILFNEFYKSKNFLTKIFKNIDSHKQDSENRAFSSNTIDNNDHENLKKNNDKDVNVNPDVYTAYEPYYHNNFEKGDKTKTQDEIKEHEKLQKAVNSYSDVLTLNLLLFHPVYLNYSYDEKFISFLLK